MSLENKEALKNLGLSDQEVGIYLALLRLGGSRASLVAKDLGMKRTTVYPILKQLARKGFLKVYFRQNTRFYYAVKPQAVSALFQKKIHAFENIIPRLQSLEQKNTEAAGLRFIETLDELKHFYRNVLEEYKNKSYCIIGSATAWEGLDPVFFIQYRKDRAAHNIKTRLILTKESEGINPTDPGLLRDVRFTPDTYVFKSTIDIYDDQILVVSPELRSLAVVIHVPVMTDVFKSVFEMLWNFLGDFSTV